MKFENFWEALTRNLTGRNEFLTLKRHKSFDAVYLQGFIEITPYSTLQERRIDKGEFLKVWNSARELPHREKFKRSNYNQITQNGSYILALMKAFLEGGKIE